jgi:hypothetical protein
LARTHELLSESNWRGASLAEIVRRELCALYKRKYRGQGANCNPKSGSYSGGGDSSSRTGHQRCKVWRTLQPERSRVGPMAAATEWIARPPPHRMAGDRRSSGSNSKPIWLWDEHNSRARSL